MTPATAYAIIDRAGSILWESWGNKGLKKPRIYAHRVDAERNSRYNFPGSSVVKVTIAVDNGA